MSWEKFILYWVRSFTYALCKPALYCLRYLLPCALTFEVYSEFIINYTTEVRKPSCLLINSKFNGSLSRYEVNTILCLTKRTMIRFPVGVSLNCKTNVRSQVTFVTGYYLAIIFVYGRRRSLTLGAE